MRSNTTFRAAQLLVRERMGRYLIRNGLTDADRVTEFGDG